MPEHQSRSRARILADILRVIEGEGEARPTHIMTKANLSYERLMRYLANMEQSGLISRVEEADKVYYSITERGRYYLIEFRRLEDFTNAFGLRL
ncbi:MAG: winged helix-turn-helix domain-containing protein [Methanomassiliicoccales archaeon]